MNSKQAADYPLEKYGPGILRIAPLQPSKVNVGPWSEMDGRLEVRNSNYGRQD